MADDRNDPYQQFNFLVEIDGITQAGFMECSGLTTDNDAIDYREGSDPTMNVRKLFGMHKYSNLMLKRGYTQDKRLWQWRESIINPTPANRSSRRRNIAIILKDEERNDVLRWEISQAWISKWESGPFNAKTNDVAVETVEIIHEKLVLVT
jgi:phage tail-like protein